MKKIRKDNIIKIMRNKRARSFILSLLIITLTILFLFLVFVTKISATSSTSGTLSTLRVWDDTDSEGGSQSKYTNCSEYCTEKAKGSSSYWNTYFFANFTNLTNGSSITTANCTIRFDENLSGTYTSLINMSFNSTKNLFEYNRSFNYKGNISWRVNCTDTSYESLNILDNVSIKNTQPYIFGKDPEGKLPTQTFNEDSLWTYNFSLNVSEDDLNDIPGLAYNYDTANTTLTNFTISGSILTANVTTDSDAGSKQIVWQVKDDGPTPTLATLPITITSLNDAPDFLNLQNITVNMNELYELIVQAKDEENNVPFNFTINFTSCAPAEWSTRGGNCTLFNLTYKNSTATNVTFTATKNDVGSYIINFTVQDNNSATQPYNATRSKIVNFTISNVNSIPYFTYVCDNERSATENSEFTCSIRARDIDELNNLTFSSNLTWFLSTTTNTTLVDYNASVLVNFTASDSRVGNWSINITVNDTGTNPHGANSTRIWFFVNNTADPVLISNISNVTAYSNNSYSVQVNASDDDLLIPDTSVYRENLTFSSNVSWISFTIQSISGNLTKALMHFTITQELIGNHTINVSVNDSSGNYASALFYLFAYNNTAPVWNSSLNLTYNLTEGVEFYLNLSEYVSDAENDAITFNFSNLSYFPSFNLTNGIMNFTPDDADVGFHRVIINASDNKTISSQTLNFSLNNTNDVPFFLNITNWNASENSLFENTTRICDNDFLITNKSIYNETLTLNLTIQGANSTLFSLVFNSTVANCSSYNISFTPDTGDIGYYNITINVTDRSNASNFTVFNLTVSQADDAPVIMNMTNYTTGVNKAFSLVINVTDEEDGNNSGGNLTFVISNMSDSTNSLFFTINSTSGLINFTSNSSQSGKYHLNVTVNDTQNSRSSKTFWLFVHKIPVLTNLSAQAFFSEINAKENDTVSFSISATDDVNNNFTAYWYIDNVLKNTSAAGTGTLDLSYRLNFTEETTCASDKTLLVNVSSPEHSNSTWWSLSVNHTNYPVTLHSSVPNQSVTGTSVTLNLADYFSDIDHDDSCYNQTISFNYTRMDSNFSVLSSGTISASFSGWNVTFSSSSEATEYFKINATDSYSTADSNNFSVRLSPSTVQQPSSGGGGSSSTKPVSLKIIMPEPISVYNKDLVVLPIRLINDGKVKLSGINLTNSVYLDKNEVKKGVEARLSKTYFDSLSPGQSENLELSLAINTEEVGEYEINVNASVVNPKYTDWGKMYLSIREANKSEAEKMIVFTEELIVSNPECLELKELLNEAKDSFEKKDFADAFAKAKDAVEACKYAVNQRGKISPVEKSKNKFPVYAKVIAVIVTFYVLVLLIYKLVMRRKV